MDTDRDGTANVLHQRRTIFAAFQRLVGQQQTLQVRSAAFELLPTATISAGDGAPSATPRAKSCLWVDRALPESLRLPALKELVPEFEVRWQHAPTRNVLRDQTRSGFTELWLTAHDRRQLQIRRWRSRR